MDDQKQQIVDKLKGAKNVLITVSMNPSVDQLAACIALTLLLNKLDKHATAVYSGETPSTIEFLQPEDTIEKNTDSLRDFIISLDKAKADKLRYKVEEKVVKIFITPYKTSLSGDDLEFSQGDFNVDVVVGLGIHRQQDIDSAITSHGRILHDATIVTINNTPNDEIGSIHWQDLSASSLSELVSNLARDLGDSVLDGQIATALLTGIVAETQRFRNNKTTPRTMSISAELMAAGANQQLVAEQLDKPAAGGAPLDASGSDGASVPPADDAGTLEITHPGDGPAPAPDTKPQPVEDDITIVPPVPAEPAPSVDLPAPTTDDDLPKITGVKGNGETSELSSRDAPKMMTEAPTLGGVLTANSRPEQLDPATDPLGSQSNDDIPLLSRDPSRSPRDNEPITQPPAFVPPPTVTPPATTPPPADPHAYDDETLSELEQTVHHDEPATAIDAAASGLDSAREAVENAIKAAGAAPERPDAPLAPVANLGWQGQLDVQPSQPTPASSPIVVEPPQPPPVDPNLPTLGPKTQLSVDEPAPLGGSPADQPLTMPLPPSINIPPANPVPPTTPNNNGPQSPPPVPPPMLPNQSL
jgi:hypothetical protein